MKMNVGPVIKKEVVMVEHGTTPWKFGCRLRFVSHFGGSFVICCSGEKSHEQLEDCRCGIHHNEGTEHHEVLHHIPVD